jgi:predicted murein hydrolase (TIGR00659 family)
VIVETLLDAARAFWATLAGGILPAHSPLLWMSVTLGIYAIADWVYKRTGLAWLNPVLTAIAALSAILVVTRTPYETYFAGTQLIHFLLGPATVALAVPLYNRIRKVQQLFGPLMIGLLAGSLAAIGSAVGLGSLLGASPPTLLSLAPKSVTTPIAMGVSEQIGGIPSLTAVLVIVTGIIGAVGAKYLLDAMRIEEPSIRGFAIGLAAHGLGTARAFMMDEETGAFAGLGMGLNGILTAVIVPILVDLVGLI